MVNLNIQALFLCILCSEPNNKGISTHWGEAGDEEFLRRRRVQSAAGRGRVHQPGEEGGTPAARETVRNTSMIPDASKMNASSLEDCLFKTQFLDRKELYRLLMTLPVPLF